MPHDRLTSADYLRLMVENFVELHGDRSSGDDPAIIAGLGTLQGHPVAIIAMERGHGEDRVRRHEGRTYPEGYRKARRIMDLAERLHFPLLTLIDTPGAYPGIESEERGLASEIAASLARMSSLRTPIVSAVIGEGGSGGALALAVADRVLMLEGAIYSVIAPEGAATILYRDVERAPEVSAKLKLTAQELRALGIVDEIIPEPRAAEPELIAETLAAAITDFPGAIAAKKGAAGRERPLRPVPAHWTSLRAGAAPAQDPEPARAGLTRGLARRGWRTRPDRCDPVLIARITASQRVVKNVLEGRRDRANLAVADLVMVDTHDWRDLGGSAAGEHLVGEIELGAVDLPLLDLEAEHLARQHDERITRNALEDAAANIGGDQLALGHHHDAGPWPLGHLPLVVQEEGGVVAVGEGFHARQLAVAVVGEVLDAWRHHVLGNASPRAHAGVVLDTGLEVRSHRVRVDQQRCLLAHLREALVP